MFRSRQSLWFAAIILAVCIVYSNSFQNSFHFDDSHTVVKNPYIRSLSNLPRFFTDATTFSLLPANRTYRPFVSSSLALDYALGQGYKPFWFHLSTFLVFLLQLACMDALFKSMLNASRPDPEFATTNRFLSLIAVAWYGLHPAMAETVNYIIQRGDIYCAIGVVAGLAVYARRPAWRRFGFYLLPVAFGMLSKPPAVVFPVLLFLYIAMFEQQGEGQYARAALASIPSLIVCGLLTILEARMTPKGFTPSTLSTYSYCITQPLVLMRYFGALFLPVHLNVDTDLRPLASINAVSLLGFLFVALLVAATWLTARRRALRPIAYGLLWFLIGSLPTSLYRLSEVENDHRMYLPFVGLVLAVVWAAWLAVEKLAAGTRRNTALRAATAAACILLAAYANGAHLRNRVWRSEESLWLDDVQKCPHNGRGLMNYGLTQMGKGAYPVALDYFQRALLYTTNYPTLETNLGIVNGAMNRTADAELHFDRSIALAPADDQIHYYYGRWLFQTGRAADALTQLEMAVRLNPSDLLARDLLASAFSAVGERAEARATAAAALRLAPGDAAAQAILAHSPAESAADLINASLYRYRMGDYAGCLAAAQQALKLDPHSAEAYTNIGAAYAGLKRWDPAIASEREALRLKPDFTLAKNNLALYTLQKAGGAGAHSANLTAEDWLNASLHDNQAGQYLKSVADARAALRLRPDYAEAYNNIAAAYTSLGQWDLAIAAAETAVRLKPDFQLAKNNLSWALAQKKRAVH